MSPLDAFATAMQAESMADKSTASQQTVPALNLSAGPVPQFTLDERMDKAAPSASVVTSPSLEVPLKNVALRAQATMQKSSAQIGLETVGGPALEDDAPTRSAALSNALSHTAAGPGWTAEAPDAGNASRLQGATKVSRKALQVASKGFSLKQPLSSEQQALTGSAVYAGIDSGAGNATGAAQPQIDEFGSDALQSSSQKPRPSASAASSQPAEQPADISLAASETCNIKASTYSEVPTHRTALHGGRAGRAPVKAPVTLQVANDATSTNTVTSSGCATFVLVDVGVVNPLVVPAQLANRGDQQPAVPTTESMATTGATPNIQAPITAFASAGGVNQSASDPDGRAVERASTEKRMAQGPVATAVEESGVDEPAWIVAAKPLGHIANNAGQVAASPDVTHGASFSHSMGANVGAMRSPVTHADVHLAIDAARMPFADERTGASMQPMRRLDIAIDDPTLGVLNVRAEMRNGMLHASLDGVAESISNSAPALHQFLQEHRVGVHTVSFSEREDSMARAVSSSSASSASGMAFGGDRGSASERQAEQPSRRPGFIAPSMADEARPPEATPLTTRGYVPAGGSSYGSSSATVSIHI